MAQRPDGKALLLGDLVQGIVDSGEHARLAVRGITQDSREVSRGGLFLAVRGQASHGMDYLAQAVEAGACCALVEPGGRWDLASLMRAAAQAPIPVLPVEALGRKAGVIAARFFGQPGQTLRVVGVTGTNGKTSISHFLAQALSRWVPAGVMGTLGNGPVGHLQPATHTTPDAVSLQAELGRQSRLGIKAVAMEVSSHALHQGRVAGVPFHTAVFSNLSHDHLDYHGSMAAYAEAKARLFRRPGLAAAVINVDDRMGRELLQEVSGRTMTVAVGSGRPPLLADRHVRIEKIELHPRGQRTYFESSWGSGELETALLGRFNVENLMLSLAVLLAWDMSLDRACDSLSEVEPVPGRMNLLGGAGLPGVVVDYAHTPDALEKALQAVREHAAGEVLCVFGCGGDRDREKRPRMGAVAERLADRVILTDDNPRGEPGERIVEEILAGMRNPGHVAVERDRARAIVQAIGEAHPEDMVLIAGKGHEDYQLVGGARLPFSDLEQARRALQERAA